MTSASPSEHAYAEQKSLLSGFNTNHQYTSKVTFVEIINDDFSSKTRSEALQVAKQTDIKSMLQGIFLGLMLVMTLYNLFLYFSLRDKAYLLYVGTAFFGILSALAMRGLSGEFLWPQRPDLDNTLYVTWGALSMLCSSRFAAIFLHLNRNHKPLNRLMWWIAGASLLLAILSLFLSLEQITPFGRILVLLTFPSYIVAGIIAYRNGFKPALYYIIAWVPYATGLVILVLDGAGFMPDHPLVDSSVTIGGSLEIVLLSFALADRIRSMRKEIAEKELEKEQMKSNILEEQKAVLEQTVAKRTHELRETNSLLQSQNETIRQREKEKAMLLQELHHRVKNNFQTISGLLNLQSRTIEDTEARQAVKESQNRIEALSMIHRELYGTHELTHMSMKNYTERLVQNLLSTSPQWSEINTKVEVDDLPLPIQKAISVGLILNELITNSLKHGLPLVEAPSLEVQLKIRTEDDQVEVVVADNGPGFNQDLNPYSGFGLQLIQTLVKQLRGVIHIYSDSGYRVSIRFEIEQMDWT